MDSYLQNLLKKVKQNPVEENLLRYRKALERAGKVNFGAAEILRITPYIRSMEIEFIYFSIEPAILVLRHKEHTKEKLTIDNSKISSIIQVSAEKNVNFDLVSNSELGGNGIEVANSKPIRLKARWDFIADRIKPGQVITHAIEARLL